MLVETKQEATIIEIETTRLAFLTIPEKIDGIEDVEWGFNNSPEGKNKSYDLALMMTFRDESIREIYLTHPEHEAFKVHFRKIIKDIVVVDYTVS
jgi:hypothetical protein